MVTNIHTGCPSLPYTHYLTLTPVVAITVDIRTVLYRETSLLLYVQATYRLYLNTPLTIIYSPTSFPLSLSFSPSTFIPLFSLLLCLYPLFFSFSLTVYFLLSHSYHDSLYILIHPSLSLSHSSICSGTSGWEDVADRQNVPLKGELSQSLLPHVIGSSGGHA